jgi:DHA1 family bicyclomycin/chloramphenicol resistance-like MFS transporter
MAEIMSMIWSVFMIVPIVAPFIGQFILLAGPWQLIFVFMGAVGLAATAWAYFRFRETLIPANRRSLGVASVTEGFAIVFGNRSALFYGIAGVFLFGGVLGLVNSAQQIYVDIYGLGAWFPVAFSVAPIVFAIAFLINSRLVARFGMRRLSHGSMIVFVVVTAIWLAFALVGVMPLWFFMVMLALAMLAQGLAWGNVGSLAMEPLGEVAGTASAVFGSFSTVGAAFLAFGIAQTFNGTTTPVIASFFVFGVCVLLCFLVAERGKLFGGRPVGTAAETQTM